MRDAPEYRREQDLKVKKVELYIFRYNPESSVEPHYDKVVVEGDIPSTVLLLLYQAVQKGQKSRFSEASCFPAHSWGGNF